MIFLLLHLVYQTGFYGLRGADSYVDYTFLKTILKDHHFILGQYVDGWPMIHIFSAIINLFTKIDPLLLAKFLPSFISSIIVLPLFLLIHKIYKNKQVSLFICLIFGTTSQFISTDALFIRETFAFFVLILFFYILYSSKQKNEKSLTLLYLLLVPVIVFSHHFTSFLILFLIVIYILVSQILPVFFFRNENKRIYLSGQINLITIFLLILISLTGYWVYHSVDIVKKFSEIFYEAAGTKKFESYAAATTEVGTPIVTLRGTILYYFIYFNINDKIFKGKKYTENRRCYIYCVFLFLYFLFFSISVRLRIINIPRKVFTIFMDVWINSFSRLFTYYEEKFI
jgi:uncharacterized membrane protein